MPFGSKQLQGEAAQQADVLVKVTRRLEDLEGDVRDTQFLLGKLQGSWLPMSFILSLRPFYFLFSFSF
jgi:hypothetical protein